MQLSKCTINSYVTPNISVDSAKKLVEENKKYAEEVTASRRGLEIFEPEQLPGSKLPGNIGVVYGLGSVDSGKDSINEFLPQFKQPVVLVHWFYGEDELCDPKELELYV